MNRIRPVLLTLALLVPAACEQRPAAQPTAASFATAGQAALDVLLRHMQQRLDLMHSVARVKWNKQSPIHDPDREQALLKDVVERGRAHGLNAEVTRDFFAAQIEAAKLVQEDDFAQWRAAKQPPFPDVPDLPSLRKQLDTLSGELLAALVQAHPFLSAVAGQRRLEDQAAQLFGDFKGAVRDAALRPLRR